MPELPALVHAAPATRGGRVRLRGLQPNRGSEPRRRRPPQRRRTYVIEGVLRFVDRHGARAALLVQGGNAAGRRLVGRTLTLDLTGARLAVGDRDEDGALTPRDLLAGDRVTAWARLPENAAQVPDVVRVRRVATGAP